MCVFVTAKFDFIFESGTERAFRAADRFLDLTADTGDGTNGGAFKFGHFQGRREHAFDESRFPIDLERCAD